MSLNLDHQNPFGLKNLITKVLFLLLAFAVIPACTVKKKKSDVPLLKKGWHNMNAHYNGFFNANVLTEAAKVSLSEQYKDNYNQILPVYAYAEADNPKAVAPDMDKAIEKVSVVVAMHRVSNWTDDCYLEMGKAQFLKKDLEGAQETLEYMADSFDPDKKRKRSRKPKTAREKKALVKEKAAAQEAKQKTKNQERKQKLKEVKAKNKAKKKAAEAAKKARDQRNKAKKKGKSVPRPQIVDEENTPEAIAAAQATAGLNQDSLKLAQEAKDKKPIKRNYFLKHRPCFQEGLVWLGRTYVQRENYDGARKLYDRVELDPNTPDNVLKELNLARAEMFLAQAKYKDAVPFLELAVKEHGKKHGKARYAFILAQTYQKMGDGAKAYEFFQQVRRYRPTYEMDFNARLSMNLFAYKAGRGTAKDAIAALEKMAKDRKNKEYLDQIFYAMAQIDLDQKDEPMAIQHLRQSLDNSTGASAQKVESYYTLAKLFHNKEDYVHAHAYYDSTKTVMNELDDRYTEVSKYALNLADIARHITFISLQDSLISIAALSPAEQKKLAEKLYEQSKKAEKAAKPADTRPIAGINGPAGLPPGVGIGGTAPSNFFAYSNLSMQRGKRDFEKKWGSDRPLEDNWRLKSKLSGVSASGSATETVEEEGLTAEDLQEILSAVPTTPEAMQATKDTIAASLYALGVIFNDRLQLYPTSLTYLDKLENNHPVSRHELKGWYYQYLDYLSLKNKAMAQVYMDKIIAKYPNTTFARALQDPNFAENYRKEEKKLQDYYSTAYNDFETGKAIKALKAIEEAPKNFKDLGEYKARFALLKALCLGKTQGLEAYKAALKEVIGQFGDTPEAVRAREMLRILDGESVAVKPGTGNPEGPKPATMMGTYNVEMDKMHFAMVVLQSTTSLETAKKQLADFNREFFRLDDLKVTNIALSTDGKSTLLIVRRFNTGGKAMDYYKASIKNPDGFIDHDKAPFELYVISQDNYRTLLSTRNIEDYRNFFEENYDLSAD
jgi:tetratricopeptide (TPR) repeat protein